MTTDELRMLILEMVADGRMAPDQVQPIMDGLSEMVYVLPDIAKVALSKKGEEYLRERGL